MGKNIALIGMPSCGKSSIGRALSKKLKYKLIDTDKYIVKKSGKSIKALFAIGEDYFRGVETEIIKEVSTGEGKVISTGGGVILRKENMRVLRQNSVIIFIDRNPNQLLKSKKLKNRPLLAEDTNKIYDLYNERIHLYRRYADITVENNGYFKGCIEEILRKLKV